MRQTLFGANGRRRLNFGSGLVHLYVFIYVWTIIVDLLICVLYLVLSVNASVECLAESTRAANLIDLFVFTLSFL